VIVLNLPMSLLGDEGSVTEWGRKTVNKEDNLGFRVPQLHRQQMRLLRLLLLWKSPLLQVDVKLNL